MAMHIHFRELFWCFLAFCRAVVPDWTLVTAFETWTDISINTTKQNMSFNKHVRTQKHNPTKKVESTKANLAFNVVQNFSLGLN